MAMRFLRRTEVESRTGLSKTTIYGLMNRSGVERFPQQVKIGGKVVAWVEQEVDEWIQRQMSSRQKAA